MARTIGSGSSITVGTGQIPTSDQFTYIAVMRVTSLASIQIAAGIGSAAGQTHFRVATSGTTSFWVDGASTTLTGQSVTASTGWVLFAVSKASGSTTLQQCRVVYDTGVVSTATHSVAAGSASAITSARLGSSASGTQSWLGDLAAAGVFSAFVAAADLPRFAYSLQSWLSLGSGAMWVLDQASASVPVLDWTGGGANQTAVTGTSVAAASSPIGYGHPIILSTRTAPATGSATVSLPALNTAGAASMSADHPWITGMPQTFGFTASGTVITYTGGGATGSNVIDVLCIASDNTVTVSGWTLVDSAVGNQGSYIYAKSGGSTTATVDLGGGIGTDTAVQWVRIAGTAGVDGGATNHTTATGSGTTAGTTSGALAGSDELVLAFAALHNYSGGAPTGFSWPSGYLEVSGGGSGSSGSASGSFGSVAVKAPAGTAAESPSVSWTNAVNDRYMLVTAFTAAPATVDGAAALTLPALDAAGSGSATASGSSAANLPAFDAAGSAAVTATGSAAVTLPALDATGTGTAGVAGTSSLTLPALDAAGAGTATATGSGSVALPALDAAGSAAATATGAAAVLLPALDAAGSGTVTATGASAFTLAALDAAGAGQATTAGAAALSLPAIDVAGSAVAGMSASSAVTLPPLAGDGAAQATATGTSGLALPGLAVAGSGDVEQDVTGSAAITLPRLVTAAAGQATATLVGGLALPALDASGQQNATRRPGRYAVGASRSKLTPGGHR